jgi:uncharacterized phiE125 gp8 family phage protein
MLCPLRIDIDALPDTPGWLISKDLIALHGRIDASDDDSLLQAYLKAAIGWAENETHRTIFQCEHRWVLREFPVWDRMEILLPRGKTQSVSSISHVEGGETVILRGLSSGSPAGASYQEDLRGDGGGMLMPLRGTSWPTVDCDVPAPVTITFSAGWATDEVPAEVVHAILFAVEDLYDIRGTGDFNAAVLSASGPRFAAREALISGYRLSRWY